MSVACLSYFLTKNKNYYLKIFLKFKKENADKNFIEFKIEREWEYPQKGDWIFAKECLNFSSGNIKI